MRYAPYIDKALSFINEHIDEELNLDRISHASCLSKYHFHRVFKAHMGSGLAEYVRWVRLKRGAKQLVYEPNRTVLDIALSAGFENHESFSRAFKKTSGRSPQDFRQQPDWSLWEWPFLENKQDKTMNVDLIEQAEIRLAVVEHLGDPLKMDQTVVKLMSWINRQSIDLSPRPGQIFGLAYHDPDKVEKDKFRFDLGTKIPEHYTIGAEVKERHIPKGIYAVFTHKGSHSTIGTTIMHFYTQWLPNRDHSLGDFPIIFMYKNFDHETPESALVTDIWVLLD